MQKPQSKGQTQPSSPKSQLPSPQKEQVPHSSGQLKQSSAQSQVPLPQTGGQSPGQLQLSSSPGAQIPSPQSARHCPATQLGNPSIQQGQSPGQVPQSSRTGVQTAS